MLHWFLLSLGGLRISRLARNGSQDEQHDGESSDQTSWKNWAPGKNRSNATDSSHEQKLANTWDLLLVKSRQISWRGAQEELCGRSSGEELKVSYHVRLVSVASFSGDLSQAPARIPKAANIMQPGQAGELLRGCADGGSELSFKRA